MANGLSRQSAVRKAKGKKRLRACAGIIGLVSMHVGAHCLGPGVIGLALLLLLPDLNSETRATVRWTMKDLVSVTAKEKARPVDLAE